ncbi:MAG TPA: aminotransferase class V-fold PLP-dependent enzyme [Rubrivivax sp.]|nr:aminotransferase class V-fold PLP-dependent enzyme [Rubrivivax sp.]
MRTKFLLAPDVVFLNHGSYGACPAEVFAEYQRWQRELESNPVEFLGRRSATLLADARCSLAAYLGTSSADLVFVANATTGVNVIAQSIALQPGDEVLGNDHEYGACAAAWQRACERRGARYVSASLPLPFDDGSWTERVLAAVTPRTRLIMASHITSTTALIFPVADLCRAARERGILTLIDGAHAPGHIELNIDAIGADFYVGNCHKWLCGPKSAGFLHARPEHQSWIEAPVISWGYVGQSMAERSGTLGGHTGFDAYTGSTVLERRLQWQGTRDISACLAVPAAIKFQRRHHWPAERRRCHELALHAQSRVLSRNRLAPVAPDSAYGQMLTIPVRADDAQALRQRLFDHYRIEVPVTEHQGRLFVRISLQAYNDEVDVDKLVRALAELNA